MRKNGKVDANHATIVGALRSAGCSVVSLADVGNGCPDILVGVAGYNILMEIKDGSKPASARGLTKDQERFHMLWRGEIFIVTNEYNALAVIHKIKTHNGRYV
jgi:Holliday junction resolvase